jgi:eukaryotic-like serine/threonine-protein kinase
VTRVDQAAPPPQPPTGRYVEEEIVAPPPRGPLIWPWLVLLLLLVGTAIAGAYFLTREDDSPADRVPAVVGMQAANAVERLRAEGYPADIRRRVDPSRRGRVVDQQPAPGTELEPGRTVVIVVARPPNTVDVPRVVGLEVTEAFERVQAAGLRGRAVEVFARQPEGRVIRQRPVAGDEARRGSTVVLTVSKGPQLVAVPALVGQTEQEARAALQRVGLRANVVRVPSAEPPGSVVDQNPLSGARIPRGSRVRLNVSIGSPSSGSTQTVPTTAEATVPNVVGQTEVAARRTLQEAGFRVTVIGRTVTDPAQDGIVVEQDPRAGTRAPEDSDVFIYVGRPA